MYVNSKCHILCVYFLAFAIYSKQLYTIVPFHLQISFKSILTRWTEYDSLNLCCPGTLEGSEISFYIKTEYKSK